MASEEYSEGRTGSAVGGQELSDKEILNRIDIADRWMKKFRDSDTMMSYRYLDVNAPATGSGEDWSTEDDWFDPEGDVPDWVPIGQPNYLAINNETKIAAIAMGLPALHVKANEDEQLGGVPNAGDIVAKAWAQSFENGDWGREIRAGLQKKGICGIGCMWYRWDDRYGPCFEHVHSKRLLIDPHATNLNRLEWGGVKVRMPLRRAMRLYDPNGENGYFKPTSSGMDEEKSLDTQVCSINLYFDKQVELHAYKDRVLHRGENLYKRVPLDFIEGFIDPRERLLPLGDNVFASGLNQQIVDLASINSNLAKHGGQITLANAGSFDDTTQEALKNGKQQQILFVKGPLNPQALPVHRISAENPSPAYGEARREAQQALDGIQGVTPGQRGEQVPNVTATQSVMVESKAGARPTQERAECEQWITRMARRYVEMMQKFAGPTEQNPGTQETQTIWRAFKAVYEVTVVEGSTSYQNPAVDQQSAMQLYTTMVQSMELYLSLSQMGLLDSIPNLKQYANDVLRAFSRQNIEQYWLKAPQPQQQPSGPPPELIKALHGIYSNAPEDVKRQIEQDFGLSPSQLEAGDDGGAGELQKQEAQHTHEGLMKALDHTHETRMKLLDQQHQQQISVANQGHQQRMAALQKRIKGNGK